MRNIVFIILLFSGLYSNAQEIGIAAGYGTYLMEDMKTLNTGLANSNVPFKLVSNFPAYWNFNIHGYMPITKKFILGGEVECLSTGSRLAYEDYSGLAIIDQRIRGTAISVLPAFLIFEDEKKLVSLDVKTGVIFTTLKLESTTQIGNDVVEEYYGFKSISGFLEPGVRYGQKLGQLPLRIDLRLALNLNVLHGKLWYEEDKELYLNANEDPAYADWSGLRLSLSVVYQIKKRR